MTKVQDVEEVQLSTEAMRVREWRFNWLVNAGYTHKNAEMLARRTDIDWRFASNLLKNSDDQEMALRILL